MKQIILLFSLCISKILFGQSSFSENLMQNVTAENLSQGVTNVQIPIKDLSIDGYKVNLGLTYNTKGVLVNSDAGVVGLNWNIAGISLITREVRDGADEAKTTGRSSILTHCPPNEYGDWDFCYEKCYDVMVKDNQGLFYNLQNLKANTQNAISNINTFSLEKFVPAGSNGNKYPAPYDDSMFDIDTEPDIFKAILPNGEYFEFYFDLDKKIKIKSGEYSNYIITYIQEGNQFKAFTIKNSDGITFYFNNYETTTDGTSNQKYVNISKNSAFQFAPQRLPRCNAFSALQESLLNEQASTAWYISKIVNQFGEEINYNYGLYNVLGWSKTKDGNFLSKYTLPVLNLIYTNSTGIRFKMEKLREDVLNNGYVSNLPEIESIEIYDINKLKNTDIAWTLSAAFSNNDFTNLNLLNTVKLNYFYSLSEGADSNYDNAVYKRMYLDNILFRNKENKNEKFYRFKYYGNLNTIPNKISDSHDSFGYTRINTNLDYYSGGTDFNDTVLGNLKSIESNDALKSFYYEKNYFQKIQQGPLPSTVGAGVRIKKIVTKTKDQEYVKEYNYGIGHAYFPIITESNDRKINPSTSDVNYDFVTATTKSIDNVVKDSTVYKYSLFNDYKPIDEAIPMGNVMYKSDLLTNYKLTAAPGSYTNNSGTTYFFNRVTGGYPYLNSRENFNLLNGKLLYVGNFNDSGQKVSESFFDYDTDVIEEKFLYAKRGEGGVYTIRQISKPLRKQTDILLFNGKEVKKSTNFFYNTKKLLNRKIENDGVNEYETNYQYAHEMNDNVGSALLANNDYNSLSKTIIKKNGLVFSAQKNIYEIIASKKIECYRNSMGQPTGCADLATFPIIKTSTLSGIDGMNFPSTTDKVTKLHYYNTVAETTDQNGQYTSYINGYNHSYAIAVIKGAKYNDVKDNQLISQATNASNSGSESNLILKLDNLRSDYSLSEYQTTTYTYKPSIGVSTVTPPSGVREQYQYDSSNRLEKVIDINGNILKEYKYNYSPIVFYSVEKSNSFTKNNCINGQISSSIVYTVPQGQYTSNFSQDDADQKALNDLNINGQNNANLNGSCYNPYCQLNTQVSSNFLLLQYAPFEKTNNNVNAQIFFQITANSGLNWSNGVLIGYIDSLCWPASTITKSSGNWQITIYPVSGSGQVVLRWVGSGTPTIGEYYSVNFNYNLN